MKDGIQRILYTVVSVIEFINLFSALFLRSAFCDNAFAGDSVFPKTARHAVGGGGVEIVFGEKAGRSVAGKYLTVKEKSAAVGVFGGKFDVVGNNKNAKPVIFQRLQKRRQGRFRKGVKPFCRLVQKQYLRLGQKRFGKGTFLLFAARKVERMFFQKRCYSEFFGNFRNTFFALGF